MPKMKFGYFLLIGVIVVTGLAVGAFGLVNAAASAGLSPDKNWYILGETVNLTGNRFDAGVSVSFNVQTPDRSTSELPALVADSTGKFITQYLPLTAGKYNIKATNGKNVANAYFEVYQSSGRPTYIDREAAALRAQEARKSKGINDNSVGAKGVGVAVLSNQPPSGAYALISGGGGTGATASVSVLGGTVSKVIVTNAGTGYVSEPTISIMGGGGIGATAKATFSDGKIAGITLTSGGYGYISPLVVISGGNSTRAVAKAEITNGAVTSIIIITGGSGYTSAPTISIIKGDGTGAKAVAKISDGTMTEITVTNGGSGYGGGVK